MSWRQTTDLRFIERRNLPHERANFILQQAWEWHVELWNDTNEGAREWRDVPCVPADTQGEP